MRISASTLNRKIAGFIDQLQTEDQWIALYPDDMPLERATAIAQKLGWKEGPRNLMVPCYSLANVVVRRLA